MVWWRPRTIIRPKDPDREKQLRALRALLHGLPADETAVFMDEVDVNLNPKVGCQWMRRGEQAAVETPGTNQKRYLAGSIHWRTGRVRHAGTRSTWMSRRPVALSTAQRAGISWWCQRWELNAKADAVRLT